MKVKLGSGMNNNNCEISLSLMWYCRIWFNLVFGARALPFNTQFFTDSAAKPYIRLVMQALRNNKNFIPYSSTRCRKIKRTKSGRVTKKSCWNVWLKAKHIEKQWSRSNPCWSHWRTHHHFWLFGRERETFRLLQQSRGATDRTIRRQWLDAHSILVTQSYRDSSWPTILRAVSRSHHAIRDGSGPTSKSRIILKVQFSLLCVFPDYYL